MESEPIRWIRRWQWWKLYTVVIKLCQQTWGTVRRKRDKVGFTLVISVVMASISCSSAVRSVKPGRACLACNLSRALTG